MFGFGVIKKLEENCWSQSQPSFKIYVVILMRHLFGFYSEVHGGEVMRINMCAAIIVMQSVFLIGAHVKAQQVFADSCS